MPQLIHPIVRGVAVAGLLGTALIAGQARAATPAPSAAGASILVAQADTTTKAKKPHKSRGERVEDRIKSLHDQLKITSAQEPQWDAVAQAMRDGAQAMEAAIKQRVEARGASAVDELKAYEAIADAHAQSVQKMIPPFQALYDSLSDDQKKTADTLFARSRREQRRAMKK
ncbi:MAG TPA: Spy/CpxP family protein refolding chaperone [Stellaceae bacterium]|nr:Spy/CpxP family protein refolding chaperone [Stellaceae bacterium]